MNDIPSFVTIIFLITVAITFGFVYFGVQGIKKNKTSNASLVVAVFLVVWLFITGIMALSDFFIEFDAVPPRFLFVLFPPLLAIVLLFSVKTTRERILQIPITTLTYLHIVRVPVEIVLWWLAGFSVLPELMTFEGLNYDILAGISAPFVAIFMVGLRSKTEIGAVIWNIIGLLLLINIVVHALLSAPFLFQTMAFDQPNIAVFYFPFIYLPSFIVPVVLFAHLASLAKLLSKHEVLK